MVISLEHPFEIDLTWRKKLKELETLKKKKQTLDELHASQKISQSTYECLEKKLVGEAIETEAQLKTLSDNMTNRAQELEKGIVDLELSLAMLEMYHATGEIGDKTYENPQKTILLNLEATKQEIKTIRSSLLEFVKETIEENEVSPKTGELEPNDAETITVPKEEGAIEVHIEEPTTTIEDTSLVQETTT